VHESDCAIAKCLDHWLAKIDYIRWQFGAVGQRSVSIAEDDRVLQFSASKGSPSADHPSQDANYTLKAGRIKETYSCGDAGIAILLTS
jgi:hypothetical protein